MNKIEQVAASLYASQFHCAVVEWSSDGLPPSTRARFMRLARAAIEAMREPTQTMKDAYETASIAPVGRVSMSGYQAMIDAALQDDTA